MNRIELSKKFRAQFERVRSYELIGIIGLWPNIDASDFKSGTVISNCRSPCAREQV